jgi:hypothetical protein
MRINKLFLRAFALSAALLLLNGCGELTNPELHLLTDTDTDTTPAPTETPSITGSFKFVNSTTGNSVKFRNGDVLTLDTTNVVDNSTPPQQVDGLSYQWQEVAGTLNTLTPFLDGSGNPVSGDSYTVQMPADAGKTIMVTVTKDGYEGSVNQTLYLLPANSGIEIAMTGQSSAGTTPAQYDFNNDPDIGSESIGPGYTVDGTPGADPAADNNVATVELKVRHDSSSNSATGALTAKLSGNAPTAFILTGTQGGAQPAGQPANIDALSAGDIDATAQTFKVGVKAGLARGSYVATLTIDDSADNDGTNTCSLKLSFTVGLAPDDPSGFFEVRGEVNNQIDGPKEVRYRLTMSGQYLPQPGKEGKGLVQQAFKMLNTAGAIPDPENPGTYESSIAGRSYQIIITQDEEITDATGNGNSLQFSSSNSTTYLYLAAHPGFSCTLKLKGTHTYFLLRDYTDVTFDGNLTVDGQSQEGVTRQEPLVKISNNAVSFTIAGNGVSLQNNNNTLNGGQDSGGGVVISAPLAYFIMEGGRITGNHATSSGYNENAAGGGVLMVQTNPKHFRMYGGAIYGNTVNNNQPSQIAANVENVSPGNDPSFFAGCYYWGGGSYGLVDGVIKAQPNDSGDTSTYNPSTLNPGLAMPTPDHSGQPYPGATRIEAFPGD